MYLYLLFKMVIFHCHVSFLGCIHYGILAFQLSNASNGISFASQATEIRRKPMVQSTNRFLNDVTDCAWIDKSYTYHDYIGCLMYTVYLYPYKKDTFTNAVRHAISFLRLPARPGCSWRRSHFRPCIWSPHTQTWEHGPDNRLLPSKESYEKRQHDIYIYIQL